MTFGFQAAGNSASWSETWPCFCSCPLAGLICPWNLPLYLLTWKIAPAIAAGNTVIAKPSELTSVTAWMLCKFLDKAGTRVWWGQGGGTERGQNCQRPPSLSADSEDVFSFCNPDPVWSCLHPQQGSLLLSLPALFNSSRTPLTNSVTL